MAKSKIVRSKLYTPYWIIWECPSLMMQRVIETNHRFDNEHFASGNYYSTPEAAQKVLDRIRHERSLERKSDYNQKVKLKNNVRCYVKRAKAHEDI